MQTSVSRYARIGFAIAAGFGAAATLMIAVMYVAYATGAHGAMFGWSSDQGYGFSGNSVLLIAAITGLHFGMMIGSPQYRHRSDIDVHHGHTWLRWWVARANRCIVYFIVLTLPVDFLIDPTGSWLLSIVYLGLGVLAFLVAILPAVLEFLGPIKQE